MLVLLDQGTPVPIRSSLKKHEVLLTTDKNLPYQQNLAGRKVALAVLGNSQWPVVRHYLGRVAAAVNAAEPGTHLEVEIPHH